MKTYVIGNSIVRELTDSGWTTICLPGADWSAIVHYVTLHRESLANSIIYVHIGPVRFTRLTNRHECVLRSRYIDDPPTLFRSWRPLIQSHNIIPVICTIYPMDFDRYNEHLKSKRNSHHIRQHLHSDYNKFYWEWLKLFWMLQLEKQLIAKLFVTDSKDAEILLRWFLYERARAN